MKPSARYAFRRLCGMLVASSALISSAYAADTPLFMEADKIAYDSKHHIVVAQGNVEIVRDGRIMLADTLYYYQDQNLVKAQGNVSVLADDGNVSFADSLLLEPDLKYGVIQQFKARFADNALFAAAEARRVHPHKMELTKAV